MNADLIRACGVTDDIIGDFALLVQRHLRFFPGFQLGLIPAPDRNPLLPEGLLFVGHSESLFKVSTDYSLIGKTVYRRV